LRKGTIARQACTFRFGFTAQVQAPQPAQRLFCFYLLLQNVLCGAPTVRYCSGSCCAGSLAAYPLSSVWFRSAADPLYHPPKFSPAPSAIPKPTLHLQKNVRATIMPGKRASRATIACLPWVRSTWDEGTGICHGEADAPRFVVNGHTYLDLG